MNAMRWADRNLKTLGDFDAFVAGDRAWRSRAVHDQTVRMAAGLTAMGVAPGDRVLLCLPNGPELAISWRAVLWTGGIPVVAHHDSPSRRIEQLAAEVEPVAVVASATHAEAGIEAPTLRHHIHTGGEGELPGWASLARIAERSALIEPVPRSDDDVAVVQYTSGSTGTPKGVVMRHGTLATTLRGLRKRFARWRQPVRHLSVLPMSSSAGSFSLFEGLGRRCTHYVLDRFDPEQVLEAIARHRIERTSLVPTMCEAILAVPNLQRFDVSSLRTVISSGAIVSADLIERFEAAFGIRLSVVYGMTGVGGVSQSSSDSKPGSVGRPFRDLRPKVVDPQGRTLAPGEVGELMLFTRKNKAVEYWNRDASPSTAADAEGWYRTGDLARFDADGEMYVVGRSDDLVIQGGHNIRGRSVAEVVERLAGVRECAVVGVPNDFLGQELVACVVLREGAELTAGDIIAHCRKHLEVLAVPTSVWFVEALPRNESGKVKSFELRDAITAARGAVHETGLVRRLAAAAPSDRHDLLRREVERILATVLREAGSLPVATEGTFHDMGLDSLGAVELTHVLSEAIGRPVPPTLTYSHPTVDAACTLLLQLMGWLASSRFASADRAMPETDIEQPRIEAFLSSAELDAARGLMSAHGHGGPAKSVLLTGANGFLGRFIALEVLSHLPPGARLYCLVRSQSSSQSLARLRDALGSDSSFQRSVNTQLESGRLVMLAGDLTRPRFGLAEDVYEGLCGEVDCIIHNAALVDHVLGYRELFAPNVLGTVEIIRLALARQIKPINYVSTVAARQPDWKRSGHWRVEPAAGYAASKWASETLVSELHARCSVPVRIYRPSHIMAHSEAPGQINAEDTLTRLLHGIVTTALAPRSFYASGRSAEGAYYDGLPADTVARSIAALSIAGPIDRAGRAEYNIVNPHRDVSLDAIADWVQSAGYKVERIDDYDAWYPAFKSRLNSLGRTQRQRSLLPLIHAWKEQRGAGAGQRYDTTSYSEHLAQIALEPAIEAPRITEAFIHKCLKDMQMLGLIGAARARTDA
jgi:fatty acid CoA ligase FadD9